MIKSFFKQNKKFYILLFSISVIYGVLITLSNYVNLPVSNFRDFILLAIHWCIVVFCTSVIIYLLTLNKWIFIIIFPIFMLLSAIMAFYSFKYDITINSAILDSTLNTNSEEASGVISFQIILYAFFIFILSLFAAVVRFKKIKLYKIWIHVLLIILGFGIIKTTNTIRYNTLNYRIPFSLFYSIKQLNYEYKLIKQDKIDISDGAATEIDSLITVVILGEALRADHLNINGYERNTTPLLSKKQIISFPNIYSEHTHTNTSLPHILTRADSSNKSPAFEEKSFISIFNKCGFYTAWIASQVPNKAFISYVNETDTVIVNKPFHSEYNFSKKLDEEILPSINNIILKDSPKKLIIVHQLGCHWFYPSHYPNSFEIFKPAIDGKTFTDEDKEKIINAYDNAIVYTDYFISEIINMLENKKSILIFIADHGEILGEEGKWLHAQNTIYEKNPAFFIWFSEKYKTSFPEKTKNAIANKNNYLRTDIIFHSVLDASLIKTPFLNKNLSIFK